MVTLFFFFFFHTGYTGFGKVSQVKAQVVDFRTVSVSWNPPDGTIRGYLITVPKIHINKTAESSPLRISLPSGNHTIHVQALSRDYLSLPVSTYAIVRGEGIFMYASSGEASHHLMFKYHAYRNRKAHYYGSDVGSKGA